MERDDNIIIFGEDVCGGTGGSGEKDAWGGAFGVTKGILGKYGSEEYLTLQLLKVPSLVQELVQL